MKQEQNAYNKGTLKEQKRASGSLGLKFAQNCFKDHEKISLKVIS
jgi:hypothetical protein